MVALRQLFYPRSLVITGVSSSPANLAKQIVDNLDSAGYAGQIYCVGRRAGTLNQRPIFESLSAIDATPDLAVLLTPAETIPAALEECGRKGVRSVVIETGGFTEFRAERVALEKEILEMATRWGITFMGPNCVGIINTDNGLVMPFYPVEAADMAKGGASFISQSGGLVHDFLKRCSYEKLRCGKLLSIGNKLMLDENDFLEFLITDPVTHSIGIYLESVTDGRRLMELGRLSQKPIVVLKGNRSHASRQIAQFHTAALAGDERVLEAALGQSGLHRVSTLSEMISLLKIFTLPLLKERNLLLITRSGGQAVLLADAAALRGFNLAPLPSTLANFVRQKVKAGVIRPTNPVDLGDVFDIRSYAEMVELSLKDQRIDGVLLFHYFPVEEKELTEALFRETADLSRAYQKPVVVCVLPGRREMLTFDPEPYFPVYEDADQALDALAVSLRHFENMQKRMRTRSLEHVTQKKQQRYSTNEIAPVSEIMPADETFALLKAAGLAAADYAIVSRVDEAQAAADRIGYPVALKIVSPVVLHKTEKAGVKLNLGDAASLEAAFGHMKADRYLVQRMVGGCETIIGAKRDPQFGPVVLFGMGGMLVELFDDVAVRVAPLDEATAAEMVDEIKGSVLLGGYRGSPALDKKAVVDALLCVSRLLFEDPSIINVDVNPLVVLERGKGAVLVDAKIERLVSPAD